MKPIAVLRRWSRPRSSRPARRRKAAVHYPWRAWYDDYTYNCRSTSRSGSAGRTSRASAVCAART